MDAVNCLSMLTMHSYASMLSVATSEVVWSISSCGYGILNVGKSVDNLVISWKRRHYYYSTYHCWSRAQTHTSSCPLLPLLHTYLPPRLCDELQWVSSATWKSPCRTSADLHNLLFQRQLTAHTNPNTTPSQHTLFHEEKTGLHFYKTMAQ